MKNETAYAIIGFILAVFFLRNMVRNVRNGYVFQRLVRPKHLIEPEETYGLTVRRNERPILYWVLIGVDLAGFLVLVALSVYFIQK